MSQTHSIVRGGHTLRRGLRGAEQAASWTEYAELFKILDDTVGRGGHFDGEGLPAGFQSEAIPVKRRHAGVVPGDVEGKRDLDR